MDIFKSLFSVEILTLIVVQFFSYLGIVKNNNKNIKQIKEQHSHELTKIELQNNTMIEREKNEKKRKIEEQSLNEVYKPIIRIYERAYSQNYLIESYYGPNDIIGNGIDEESRKKVEDIVESNLKLINIKYIDIFEKALLGLKEDEETAYKNIIQSVEGQNKIYYIFDENKEFINSIREEAIRIENDYN